MRGASLPETLVVVPAGALGLGQDVIATAGSWERAIDTARFTPRFLPLPGSTHVVLARSEGSRWRELVRVDVPARSPAPSTVVETIEPGVDTIPANLLRFAVTFSTEMEEGSAADRLHLLDESGKHLPGTLLDMPPELWDRARRRLTVLVEPGRIKRGLQPNVLAGSPLREGTVVSLLIESKVLDVHGVTLAGEVRRRYRVGPPVRRRVDPEQWQIEWPNASGDPVVVRFDRSLDRVLVQRWVRAVDANGSRVPGRLSVDPAGLAWVFAPEAAAAVSALQVDTRLEDLAGNSVRRVFDRDLSSAADDGIDDAVVVLRRP